MRTSIFEFISENTKNAKINDAQQTNISEIIKQSRKFKTEAGISEEININEFTTFISDETIILESGHQPNYFPYSGVFKKAFLLNYICDKLKKNNKKSLAFFGFADQNLSTSSNLYKNIIPGSNKYGVEKIGFNIEKKDKWKCFNHIEKPAYESWEKEIKKIEKIYSNTNFKFLQEILEIMWKSYESADNFSDLNAFIFSKICMEIFNLKVYFFRYSDINKNNIFLEETKRLLNCLGRYNLEYNSAIINNHLNIREIETREIPLWYHCSCGGKIPIKLTENKTIFGICPACKKSYNLPIEYNFKTIENYYHDMSFSAIARNLIFAEGFGTSIFVSGPGGGLKYGQISAKLAPVIGFNLPAAIVWKSKDYYPGKIQRMAIKNFKREYNLDEKLLLSPELYSEVLEKQNSFMNKIKDIESGISHNIKNNKNFQANKGKLLNLRMNGQMTSKIFSSTPSFLDIIMNVNSSEISDKWIAAIENNNAEQSSKAYHLKQDITYGDNRKWNFSSEKIPLLYHNLKNIPVIKIDKKHSGYQSTHR